MTAHAQLQFNFVWTPPVPTYNLYTRCVFPPVFPVTEASNISGAFPRVFPPAVDTTVRAKQ